MALAVGVRCGVGGGDVERGEEGGVRLHGGRAGEDGGGAAGGGGGEHGLQHGDLPGRGVLVEHVGDVHGGVWMRETPPPRNYPAKLSQPRRTRPRRNTTNSPPGYSLGAVRETSRQSLRREIQLLTLHPHSSTPMFGAIVNREYSPQRAAYSPAHPLTRSPTHPGPNHVQAKQIAYQVRPPSKH